MIVDGKGAGRTLMNGLRLTGMRPAPEGAFDVVGRSASQPHPTHASKALTATSRRKDMPTWSCGRAARGVGVVTVSRLSHAVQQGDEADEAFGGTRLVPREPDERCRLMPAPVRNRGHRLAAYRRCSADLMRRLGEGMRIPSAVVIVVSAGYLSWVGCSAHRGVVCDLQVPTVGRVVSEQVRPMCAGELPWAPAVMVVFVTDPSGAVAKNGLVCARSSKTGRALKIKVDHSGVALLVVEGDDAYELKASQPGYRAFFAKQVRTSGGCVTWLHAVTDVPAISG
jgi:hypothetical protein